MEHKLVSFLHDPDLSLEKRARRILRILLEGSFTKEFVKELRAAYHDPRHTALFEQLGHELYLKNHVCPANQAKIITRFNDIIGPKG